MQSGTLHLSRDETSCSRVPPAVCNHNHGESNQEHRVQFYHDDKALTECVAEFLVPALQAGHHAVVVATAPHREAIEKSLTERGIEVNTARSSGLYIDLDAAETLSRFMVGGMADEARFTETIGQVINQGTDGQSGPRVFGEMVALLWDDGESEAAIQLERLWNDLQKKQSFSLLCAYPMSGFRGVRNAADFTRICDQHSQVSPSEDRQHGESSEADWLREIAILQQKAISLETEIAERRRTEEALQRSKAELSAYVEIASVGLHWVGHDGIIQWANATEYKMLGYTREEYVGHHIGEFHVDPAALQDLLNRIIRGEVIRDWEASLKAKDGTIITVLIDSSAHWDHGQFIHTQCFTRDISSRKRAEADSCEQARTLAILNRVGASLVAELDGDNILKVVTEAGREICGAEFGAFFHNTQGKAGTAFVPTSVVGIRSDAFDRFMTLSNINLFAATFEGKGVVRIADALSDPRVTKRHADPVVEPALRSYLAVPVMTRAGEVLGGLFYGHTDPGVFTARAEESLSTLAAQAAVAIESSRLNKDLEHELASTRRAEEANRRLASIVESSEDAIIAVDFNAVISSWNKGAEQIFGYRAEEIVGQPVSLLIPPGRDNEEPSILARIKQGEKIEHYETVRRRKDGELIDISLSVSPIKDADGKIIGASKIGRNITQRKRDEKALKEAQEELAKSHDQLEQRVQERTASLRDAIAQMEEFSYTVSHDLRAPLRAMQAYSQALAEDFRELLEANPNAKHYLQRIDENAARLDRLVRDVLTFSRIARAEIPMTRVCLDRLVRDIVDQYPGMQSPHATITVEPLDDVIGHEPSVTQAISNLLSNAVKFVPVNVTPKIRVSSERCGGRVRVNVDDNGIGIDPRYQHRLFTMFERVHPNLAYEGTGVGLAIVRKATERMGGCVGMQSDGKNGCRFWIELSAPSDKS